MSQMSLLSGFDVRRITLPDDARVLRSLPALPPLERFQDACTRALDAPLAGRPVAELLRPNSHVCIVVDDPSWPVPRLSLDCRRAMLHAVLELLRGQGIRAGHITALVANGLNRQWRNTELTELFGVETTASYSLVSHDAESPSRIARIGDMDEGPVELARSVAHADLVVHVNVVTSPLMAGWFGLVSGTAGYRTARFLSAPALFEGEQACLRETSSYHRIHERLGQLLSSKTQVVQLSAVLNNELWGSAVAALLQSGRTLHRPTQMWNALPAALRHRAARLMRARSQPIWVAAGPPSAVAPKALEAFCRQHELEARGEADVVVFGLPDIGPYSVGSSQNPVLATHLALGYVSQLLTDRPLLRPGGALIFANPLTPSFDRAAHLPHEEFYEKVLRVEHEPAAIHERFEAYFSGRPEYVSNYQRRFAYHGTHPLYCWYQCTPARRRAGKIFVAHGDAAACARLGFMPALDVEGALEAARRFLGNDRPSVTALELPPPFFVKPP